MSLAVHCIPCRAVDGALASITAQYVFKDSKSSVPGDRNNKHEILSTVGRLVLLMDPLFPQLLGFVRVAEAILNVKG